MAALLLALLGCFAANVAIVYYFFKRPQAPLRPLVAEDRRCKCGKETHDDDLLP